MQERREIVLGITPPGADRYRVYGPDTRNRNTICRDSQVSLAEVADLGDRVKLSQIILVAAQIPFIGNQPDTLPDRNLFLWERRLIHRIEGLLDGGLAVHRPAMLLDLMANGEFHDA